MLINYTVLPNPPIITVYERAGEVHYSSLPNPSGLELNHYDLIITDITNQSVYEDRLLSNSNTVNVGRIFNTSLCSPYFVTLQAHNNYGFTESAVQVGNSEDNLGKFILECCHKRCMQYLDIFPESQICSCINMNGERINNIICQLGYFSIIEQLMHP